MRLQMACLARSPGYDQRSPTETPCNKVSGDSIFGPLQAGHLDSGAE